MRDWRIRAARAADLTAIAAIYRDEVLNGAATFEIEPPDVPEMTQRFDKLAAANLPYLVAEDESGNILGYAYAGLYHPRAAYRFTVEDSIYLAPPARGRGIGTALLTRLLAECETLGFRQMIAVIGDSANAGSIGLHRKAGFAMIGAHRSVGLKFGRWIDIVLMQRPLGAGDADTPAA